MIWSFFALNCEIMDGIANKGMITEGDMVIVKKDKNLKVVPVRRNCKLWIERCKFFLDSAIGFPYGTSFEVANLRLIKVKMDSGADISLEQEQAEDDDEGCSMVKKDNRHLTDTTDNQKLTSDSIRSMRKEGIHGEEIVEQLIQNSSTFNQKNEFARQKYIKKKKKKYMPIIQILKPSARLLLEMYYNKGPNRICNLRVDSLGQLLSGANVSAGSKLLGANVSAGSKLLVVESCVGLVLGAVMERMAGHGDVIHVFNGSAPVQQAVESFDFPKEYRDKLFNFPLSRLATLSRKGTTPSTAASQPGQDPSDQMPDLTADILCEAADQDVEMDDTEDITDDGTEEGKTGKAETPESCDGCRNGNKTKTKKMKRKYQEMSEDDRRKRWEGKQKYFKDVQTMIEQADCDGLIVATKFHPTPIVMNLIDFMAPSRPVAIFCQYKEPLMDCYTHLRDRGGVVLLKLTETWLRGYQVLPNRTHPTVNMSGGGGYLLTGTTVTL